MLLVVESKIKEVVSCFEGDIVFIMCVFDSVSVVFDDLILVVSDCV